VTPVSISIWRHLVLLQRIVRHVGGGGARSMQRGPSSLSGSRLSSCLSMEELGDDFDTRSLAPSMSASLAPSITSLRSRQGQGQAASHSSSQSVASFSLGAADRPLRRVTGPEGSLASSRESSKESNSTDSQEDLPELPVSIPRKKISVEAAGERHQESKAVSPSSQGSVGERRQQTMVKSLSQESPCETTVSPSGLQETPKQQTLHNSSSDTALHSKAMASLLSVHRGLSRISPPSHSGGNISEVDESSDTGSVNDLDPGKKKKRSFFIFKKKKEKTFS